MSKKDKSKSPKLRHKRKLSLKSQKNFIKAVEGIYTVKSFLGNLSKSMGKEVDIIYPEKADKIFKINDLVDLRLIYNKTYIYINNRRFVQCSRVLLNVEADNLTGDDVIRNMDEAMQILGNKYSPYFVGITPEEAFMAHCSNIQAFFENELNTDLLHSNIAFPLLKELVDLGYKPAERVFTGEIIKRYNEGTWKSRKFLISEGYLSYLNEEDEKALKIDKDFMALTGMRIPKILEREIDRGIYDKEFRIPKHARVGLIRVFEYNDVEMEFKEVIKELPLSTLLDSNKILLFDYPERDRVWIWHGTNSTTRMKYYARKLLPTVKVRHGIGFKITSVDEGIEPSEFNKMVNLEEEPDYEEILTDINKLKSFREKLRAIEKIDIDFKLVEDGIAKIKTIMKKESVSELTIHRRYLQEMFDAGLIEISNADGFPIFKPGVLDCFEFKGIFTKIYGNVLKFFKLN